MIHRSASAPSAELSPTASRVLTHAVWLYDLLQPLVMFGQEGRLNRILLEALAPAEGERILDIGCGTGLLTAQIASRLPRGEAVGVDASLPMIETARRKQSSGRCRFEPALAEDLPFDDSCFDGAVSALFFHHVPMELKRRAAREMLRVLRPGGRIVIADLDRPWTFFGKFYTYSGWILLRQPEIKENIDGCLTDVFRGAGVEDLVGTPGPLGCIRIWHGRKPTA